MWATRQVIFRRKGMRGRAFQRSSMRSFFFASTAALLIGGIVLPAALNAEQVSLAALSKSKLKSATAVVTTYRGSVALRLIPKDPKASGYVPGGPLAILNDVHFRNGVIDVDVSGAPAKGADESARGFIGVAFRVQSESRFEIIYVRPTNSHADDQLRRNHTTQYSAEPDWPWDRLRTESPGVYESWADMEAGEWTHLRIVVRGTNASFYVNRALSPCLVIHGLKLGDSEGSVGLWMGQDTEGYFRNLSISKQ